MTTLLLVAASWIFVLMLVTGLCAAARRGDVAGAGAPVGADWEVDIRDARAGGSLGAPAIAMRPPDVSSSSLETGIAA